MHLGQNTFRTALPCTEWIRVQMLKDPEDFQHVKIGPNSLQNSLNTRKPPPWAVLTAMLRHPTVAGLVPVPTDVAAICTQHPITWAPSLDKETVTAGFKAFLNRPAKDSPIVAALRPGLADVSANQQQGGSASEKKEEIPGDSEVATRASDKPRILQGRPSKAKKKAGTTPDNSDSDSGVEEEYELIGARGQSFASTAHEYYLNIAKQIYTDDEEQEEYAQCLSKFKLYEEGYKKTLPYLLMANSGTQRQLLHKERHRLTNWLSPMAQIFDVTRKRTRQWIRSCEGAACHNIPLKQTFTGVFSPEMQGAILAAFADYTAFPNEKTKAALYKAMPGQLLHRKPPKIKDPDVPANNPSKQARKKRDEQITKAR